MLTLGVETSGREGEVALWRDGKLLSERQLLRHGRRHAQSLIAEAATLFQLAGTSVSACDAVAVSIGPGSFTGLRVGVVFAKTLAYAVGCQIVGVDTFEAVAANSPADVDRVFVVANAQREELFVGEFQRISSGIWQSQHEIQIHSIEKWQQARTAGDVITGPGAELLDHQHLADCRILDPQYHSPSATRIAEIGARRLAAGDKDDLWTLVPFYMRKSAAEEKRDLKNQNAV